MKRLFIIILSVFLLSGMVSLENKTQAAEKYPEKPITFIHGLGPGSDFEIAIRPLLQKASDILGKPIVIVHKPGAGHTIAYREIYAAKPDGYTIGSMLGNITWVKLQGLLPYDYHDYTIINTAMTMYPIIAASKKTNRPFKTIEEVFTFAKSNPGEVTIATTPVGQALWVAAMYLQEKTGLKFNIIPQEAGAGMAVTQVAGGHADTGIFGLTAAKAQIDAGNLNLLASISPHRAHEPYNYAPTLREVGYDIIFRAGIVGIMGPPKMPKDIVDKLAKIFETAFNEPKIQRHLIAFGQTPLFMRSDDAIKRLDVEREITRNILAKTGLLKEK